MSYQQRHIYKSDRNPNSDMCEWCAKSVMDPIHNVARRVHPNGEHKRRLRQIRLVAFTILTTTTLIVVYHLSGLVGWWLTATLFIGVPFCVLLTLRWIDK